MPQQVFEGHSGSGTGRIAIVAARFNSLVTARLVQGAYEALAVHGLNEQVDLAWVPGSFEIPLVALRLAESGHYAALVCLGCVVRGDTDHYDHIARCTAQGIQECALRTGVPVVFGVLTTETMEQALQRCGPGPGNSGYEAACTALRMAHLMAQLPRKP